MAVLKASKVLLDKMPDQGSGDSAPPFGFASTAVLMDGTFLVAVARDSWDNASFTHVWHLDDNLNVLGELRVPTPGSLPKPQLVAMISDQCWLLIAADTETRALLLDCSAVSPVIAQSFTGTAVNNFYSADNVPILFYISEFNMVVVVTWDGINTYRDGVLLVASGPNPFASPYGYTYLSAPAWPKPGFPWVWSFEAYDFIREVTFSPDGSYVIAELMATPAADPNNGWTLGAGSPYYPGGQWVQQWDPGSGQTFGYTRLYDSAGNVIVVSAPDAAIGDYVNQTGPGRTLSDARYLTIMEVGRQGASGFTYDNTTVPHYGCRIIEVDFGVTPPVVVQTMLEYGVTERSGVGADWPVSLYAGSLGMDRRGGKIIAATSLVNQGMPSISDGAGGWVSQEAFSIVCWSMTYVPQPSDLTGALGDSRARFWRPEDHAHRP